MELQKMADLPESGRFIFEHHATEASGSFVEMDHPEETRVQGTFIWKGSERCVIDIKQLIEGQKVWSYTIDWNCVDNHAEMFDIYIMNMNFWIGVSHDDVDNQMPNLVEGLLANPNKEPLTE